MKKTQTQSRSALPRPEGHPSITPGCTVKGAAEVVAFLKSAFGAEVVDEYAMPDGALMHAEVKVNGTVLMLGEPTPGSAPMPGTFSLYFDAIDDVDAAHARALQHGATLASEVADQPWGYRAGCVVDPGGNRWTVCAVTEQLSHDEIVERMSAAA